jgi:hypothetical protein
MPLFVVVVAALFLIGCGKSESEKQAEKAAEDLKKATEAMATAAANAGTDAAAKGMTDMAKAMQGMAAAMGGGSPDGKPVEPVATDALKGTLPSVSGWEMAEPRFERMTSPIAFSQVEAEYQKGDAELEVKIVDTGYAQMLIAPWAMFLASGFSRESNEGYEKATTVAGNPGFEKWQKDSKHGELNIVVGKRFLVTIEGSDLADTRVLHEVASKMDFGKIAGLK